MTHVDVTLFALFRIFIRLEGDGNTMILVCVFLEISGIFLAGNREWDGFGAGAKQSEEKVFLFEWEVTDPLRDD